MALITIVFSKKISGSEQSAVIVMESPDELISNIEMTVFLLLLLLFGMDNIGFMQQCYIYAQELVDVTNQICAFRVQAQRFIIKMWYGGEKTASALLMRRLGDFKLDKQYF